MFNSNCQLCGKSSSDYNQSHCGAFLCPECMEYCQELRGDCDSCDLPS